LNSSKRSYSFIFGIGEEINPLEYHSRYLVNSGFKDATAANPMGQLVGVRGSAKLFFNGTKYIDLDGTYNILGSRFGSPGNNYNNESKTQLWQNQTFNNGKTTIPGWINGVFDNFQDPDTVWNYDDNRQTYEYTESTNEIVSTAVELFAYADAQYNNRTRHAQITFSSNPHIIVNGTLSINSNPTNASVFINSVYTSRTPLNLTLQAGNYSLVISKIGYQNKTDNITIISNQTLIKNYNLTAIQQIQNGTLNITSTPIGALVLINGTNFTTPASLTLQAGNYSLIISKSGYQNISDNITIISNQTLIKNYNLTAIQ
jgi:hypothetical protein